MNAKGNYKALIILLARSYTLWIHFKMAKLSRVKAQIELSLRIIALRMVQRNSMISWSLR